MKERGILMSTAMVRAHLDDRKTETRRTRGLEVINIDPDDWQFEWMDYTVGWSFTQLSSVNKKTLKERTFTQKVIQCPYGLAVDKDRLYVRETWSPMFKSTDKNSGIIFRADYGHRQDLPDFYSPPGGWKPSLHLKKDHSRIWLEIKKITVERLHKITADGAKSEGIFFDNDSGYWFAGDVAMAKTPVACYQELWETINGNWETNPWVWVVKYNVLSKNGKP